MMELTNATGLPAKMLAGSTADSEMVYAIGCKVTYRLDAGWLIPVAAEEAWTVFDVPFEFEGVILGPELDVRKTGIDVLVFGKAISPAGKPVRQLTIGIECGHLRHQLMVFGDRVWKKSPTGLRPTVSDPFEEMPLTNDRAFGGKAILEGLQVAHAINPDGKGFYLTENEAEGKHLPNLERPDQLIRTVQDHPKPACLFKPAGSLRIEQSENAKPEEVASTIIDEGFHQTVPELIAWPQDLGQQIRLSGFSTEGDLTFPAPHPIGPTALATAGHLTGRFPSHVSTIVILVRERALIVTYLCAFRYLMRPADKRHVELTWPGEIKVPQVPT